jgi:hypothetical protein
MKKTLFIGLLGAIVATTSCNNQEPKSTEKQEQTTADVQAKEEEQSAMEIELNNGAKWKVNPEMMVHVRASEGLVDSYINAPQKDHEALAKELNTTVGLLTKSCTMQGKSHDELHKWLHPYMGLIKDLGNAKSDEEADQIVTTIQASFVIFNQYFE